MTNEEIKKLALEEREHEFNNLKVRAVKDLLRDIDEANTKISFLNNKMERVLQTTNERALRDVMKDSVNQGNVMIMV